MELMTLAQLAEASAQEVRTIRYYTTLGLIDRAAEMRGRTAFYSQKHVEQLNRIKQLQADGLTLNEIATQLRPRADFWRERPVSRKAVSTMQTIELAPGVLLTVDKPVDPQAVVEAAQSLVEFLKRSQ